MMSKKIFIIVLLFSLILKTFSQETGVIRGQVFDKSTGEALIGALVVVQGTKIGSLTDFDGNYSIEIAPGVYNLDVSFFSYETTIIEGVEVLINKVNIVDTQLGEGSVPLDEVVISAKENYKSENSLIVYKKNATGIIDGISSDEMSKFGDGNAASALKRVTGLTVESGKYVYVRGLSGRYTVTTLNGASFPALDPDEKNSVQMDLFPSNIIDNIVVSKTFLPDMPGDATGGHVDIRTADFPDRFTFQFSNSISYNPQANLNENFLSTGKEKYDWLGIDGGSRNIPPYAQSVIDGMKERGTEIIIFNPVAGSYGYTESELNAFTNAFNTNVYPITKKSFLNHSHKLSFGNQIQLKKERALGYIVALSYIHDFDYFDDGASGLYKHETLDDDQVVIDRLGEEETKLAGLLNLNYKINNNHKISLKTFRNQAGVNYSRYRIGTYNWESEGVYIQDRAMGFIGRTVNLAQLQGKHSFDVSLPKQMIVNWTASYASMDQSEPDARFFTNQFTNPDSEDFDEMTTAEFKFRTNTTPIRIYNNINEYNIDTKFDAELPLKKVKIKFGAGYVDKLRESDQIKLELADAASAPYDGNFELDGNLVQFIENNVINDDGTQEGVYYRMDIQNNALSSFEATNSIISGFGMFDLNISHKIKLLAGVRFERSDIYAFNKGNEALSGGFVKNDFLPSVNLILKPTDNMNIRLAGSQTVSRPAFEEIAPISIYKYKYGYRINGNPDLKRSLNQNVDIRWEYFLKRGEMIAVSGFYKNIIDAIESTLDPGSVNYEIIYFNSDKASLYGVELEARKEIIKNLSAGVNFTFIKSSVALKEDELDYRDFKTRPMTGQAPYVINAHMSYNNQNLGLKTNLAFNTSGEKLFLLTTGYTPYIYEMPRPDLNFNIEKELGRGFSAEFSIDNILDSEYQAVHHGTTGDKFFLRFSKGRTYGISIKYSI